MEQVSEECFSFKAAVNLAVCAFFSSNFEVQIFMRNYFIFSFSLFLFQFFYFSFISFLFFSLNYFSFLYELEWGQVCEALRGLVVVLNKYPTVVEL